MKYKKRLLVLTALSFLLLIPGCVKIESSEETSSLEHQLLGINGSVKVFYASGALALHANVTAIPQGGIMASSNTGSNGIANFNIGYIISSASSTDVFPSQVSINAICSKNSGFRGSKNAKISYSVVGTEGNLRRYRGEFRTEVTLSN